MNVQTYPSKLLEAAVEEISKLPGIGRRTALRMSLHLLRQSPDSVDRLTNSISELRHSVMFCKVCGNISDTPICPICSNPRRNSSLVCVVETVKDVMMVESTQQYSGLYHVLGGVISPMDGVSPADLNISSLIDRVAQGGIKEVVLALSATMEGDTTNFFLYKKLKPYNVDVSILARGVSFGDELEYTDEITLGRAIVNRVKFNMSTDEL